MPASPNSCSMPRSYESDLVIPNSAFPGPEGLRKSTPTGLAARQLHGPQLDPKCLKAGHRAERLEASHQLRIISGLLHHQPRLGPGFHEINLGLGLEGCRFRLSGSRAVQSQLPGHCGTVYGSSSGGLSSEGVHCYLQQLAPALRIGRTSSYLSFKRDSELSNRPIHDHITEGNAEIAHHHEHQRGLRASIATSNTSACVAVGHVLTAAALSATVKQLVNPWDMDRKLRLQQAHFWVV